MDQGIKLTIISILIAVLVAAVSFVYAYVRSLKSQLIQAKEVISDAKIVADVDALSPDALAAKLRARDGGAKPPA